MEILLAIVVASAVIFFGALISMGNERQRKAIDGLREQVVLWAIQDLKTKREHLAQNIQIDDPINWLNNIVYKVYGYDPKLQFEEFFEQPQCIVFSILDNTTKIVLSPLSPMVIRKINQINRNQLLKFANTNPIFNLALKDDVFEITPLIGGPMFDRELEIVWKKITNQNIVSIGNLWCYRIRGID